MPMAWMYCLLMTTPNLQCGLSPKSCNVHLVQIAAGIIKHL